MKKLGLLAEERAPAADGAGATPELAAKLDGVLERAGLLTERARMRLAELRASATTRASAPSEDGDGIVDLGRLLGEQYPTLGARLARAASCTRALALGATSKATIALDEIRYLPTVPDPEKIICIGINYGNRNEEYKDGAEAPKYPSVFMRTPGSLVGHLEPILQPAGIRAARLRGRDRARDRQGRPAHRRARTRGSTSRGCR